MRIIIVEDEFGAAQNMLAVINEVDSGINIEAVLESVEATVNWINNNPKPDLGFFDIQLADDNVFRVFERTKVNFPVVFTTAYNEYAIQAFKVNSIDYILKPVSNDSVRFAINKYHNLKNFSKGFGENKLDKILKKIKGLEHRNYKRSFLVHYKDQLLPVEVEAIAYFYIGFGTVYGVTKDKKRYVLNQNLDDLEHLLDPEIFFRANRQLIVSRKAIKEINLYFNGRLSLKILPEFSEQIIISKARVPELKKWLDG